MCLRANRWRRCRDDGCLYPDYRRCWQIRKAGGKGRGIRDWGLPVDFTDCPVRARLPQFAAAAVEKPVLQNAVGCWLVAEKRGLCVAIVANMRTFAYFKDSTDMRGRVVAQMRKALCGWHSVIQALSGAERARRRLGAGTCGYSPKVTGWMRNSPTCSVVSGLKSTSRRASSAQATPSTMALVVG